MAHDAAQRCQQFLAQARHVHLPQRHRSRIEQAADEQHQPFGQRMQPLQLGHQVDVTEIAGVFEQHLAVANEGAERQAQFVLELDERFAPRRIDAFRCNRRHVRADRLASIRGRRRLAGRGRRRCKHGWCHGP